MFSRLIAPAALWLAATAIARDAVAADRTAAAITIAPSKMKQNPQVSKFTDTEATLAKTRRRPLPAETAGTRSPGMRISISPGSARSASMHRRARRAGCLVRVGRRRWILAYGYGTHGGRARLLGRRLQHTGISSRIWKTGDGACSDASACSIASREP